jgi:phosphopantothenoylcysteine synthetase/decarboxylase
MSAARTVVLGVSASIAAYRAADIASALTKAGHAVHCVLTPEALHFVSPLVLGTLTRNHVTVRLADEEAGRPGHIELADAAHLVLIAPATANVLAQAALGLAPDALTSLLLATRAPIVFAPAMNGKMWEHPATRAHVETLRARGAEFIGPEDGMLACGYEGTGRLAAVDTIVARALTLLGA